MIFTLYAFKNGWNTRIIALYANQFKIAQMLTDCLALIVKLNTNKIFSDKVIQVTEIIL